ncbi:MAG TPA: cob(I)yrinic acid a,c-diamide adenosyltransferase [Desulfobacterales bacterium]|nr:cob(I)yrinic acid a,c-diamide adenosyltransferase [Desulfobacterales bacterium]
MSDNTNGGARNPAPLTQTGMVHVYTGDGKGKTTAALGLALRAAGYGWRTYIAQFMKGQEYGELKAGELLGNLLTIEQFGKPTFIHVGAATPEDTHLAHQGLEAARRAMLSGQYRLVILDEVNVALYFDLLTVQEVIEFLDARPEGVEVVLTGRRAPATLMERADYVTEMIEIKHPYQQGITARKGIEF